MTPVASSKPAAQSELQRAFIGVTSTFRRCFIRRRIELQIFHEMSNSVYGIVIVGRAGGKPQRQVELVGGGHGSRNRIEIHGLAAGGPGPIDDCFGESEAQAETAGARTHPQPLPLPRIGSDGGSQCAPRNETRRFSADVGHQRAAALLVIAERQSIRFFFKRAEAKMRSTSLRDYKTPIFT